MSGTSRRNSSEPLGDPSSARAWLAKLVSFDTTSSKTNLPLIQYVASYARDALKAEDGTTTTTAACAKVLVEYGPQQNGVSYANLVVSIPAYPADHSQRTEADTGAATDARAPTYTGGFMLSGHSDCVPVDGQVWDTDPFELTEKDGKLYGRGACDMKGFLAVVLSLVPEWARAMREGKFRKPLHLVFTYSEETDMEGCLQLLQDGSEAWRRLQACEGAIIGEPTLMELVIAHKGIHENRVTCRGTAAHSSQQDASFNAIEPATRILTFLFGLRDRFVREGPYDSGFDVPYTTFCPGQVRGGQALNTTPDLCTLAYQFRNVPEHDPKLVEREIRAFVGKENAAVQAAVRAINEALDGAKAGQTEQRGEGKEGEESAAPRVTASVELGSFSSSPHFQGNPSATVVHVLQQAVMADESATGNGNGKTGTELHKVSFYTEAGEFQHKGLMTVVCGPGSIDQAHKPNEFIAVEQLEKGVRVVRQVVESLCF